MVSRISSRGVLAVVATAAVSLTCGEGTGTDANVVSRVVITPALDTLQSLGEQLTLSVVAYSGSRVYDGGEYTWERSDTAVLFLATGVPTSRTRTVTARKNGGTIVRVREARGASDSARIVVRQQVARFVPFGGPPSRAYRACSLPAGLVAVDARGHEVADAVLHWRSSDPTLARG